MERTAQASPPVGSPGAGEATSEKKRGDKEQTRGLVLCNFGSVARWMGFLSAEQALEAVALQSAEDAAGLPRRPIGAICRELGFMTEEQVGRVLSFLHSRR